jgi:DNA-binding transcriptional LysR family regulator
VQLTAAGRTLLDEAPAALDRAAEHTRLAGAGAVMTLRLGYTPVVGFDTLPALLATAEQDHPELTVVAREHFSAAIPERLLAGDLDVGIALHPEPIGGVEGELLRSEPVTALLSTRHRLAGAQSISLGELRNEPLLLFPRPLAPAYYDRIVAACERAGFQPRIQSFQDPPVNAMLARLPGGHEIGLTPRLTRHPRRRGRSRHRRPRHRRPGDPGGTIDPLARTRPVRRSRALPRQRATVRHQQALGRSDWSFGPAASTYPDSGTTRQRQRPTTLPLTCQVVSCRPVFL